MGRPASSSSTLSSAASTGATSSFRSSNSKRAAAAAAAAISKKRHSSASLAAHEQKAAEAAAAAAAPRPKRRATNAHIFRYLQHGNPSRLQDRDLKRALEASLEDCSSDLWPTEDTASCSSSDQSNAPSGCASIGATLARNSTSKQTSNNTTQLLTARPIGGRHRSSQSSALSGGGDLRRRSENGNTIECNCRYNGTGLANGSTGNPSGSGARNQSHATNANHQLQCPVHAQKRPTVHKRFKPVAKKNIYYEADFFHEGIMEYISYELVKFSLLGDPERMKAMLEGVHRRDGNGGTNKLAKA